jgi:hypothetical protein
MYQPLNVRTLHPLLADELKTLNTGPSPYNVYTHTRTHYIYIYEFFRCLFHHPHIADELETLNTGPNPYNVQGKCSDARASNYWQNSTVFVSDRCLYPVVRNSPGLYTSMYVVSLGHVPMGAYT